MNDAKYRMFCKCSGAHPYTRQHIGSNNVASNLLPSVYTCMSSLKPNIHSSTFVAYKISFQHMRCNFSLQLLHATLWLLTPKWLFILDYLKGYYYLRVQILSDFLNSGFLAGIKFSDFAITCSINSKMCDKLILAGTIFSEG